MTAESKKRLTRPTRPDRSQLDAQIEKLRTQISKCHDKMGELKNKIDNIKEGRKGQGSATSGPRNKLIALRTELKGLFEEQNGIRTQLKALDAQKDAVRAQQKAIREKCQYVKVEDIDAAIERLENEMAHTSMPLNEEKKIVVQISELRKSKALVKELFESSGGAVDPAARDALYAQLKAVGEKITSLKAEEQEQRKIMDQIKAELGESKDEIPDLFKQKSDQYEIVKKCKETINKLRDEHRKVEDEYWTKERAWRAQAKEDRQKKWEAEQEERKKRDIERKQRQLDEAGEPFDREVTTCEQLVSYLKTFDKEEVAAEEVKSAPQAQDGMVVLNKKDAENEMDSWFTGSGKGKKKGGKKKATKPEKIVHSMDIISSFASLGLTAPTNKSGMSELITKLGEKKAEYLEKRKDEHVKRAAQKEAIAAQIAEGETKADEGEEKTNGTAEEKPEEAADAPEETAKE
ncbi:hypothetical protein A3770_06p43160 [Chloropicon primus]|uniref:Nuclear segregation protein Bfr1 n=1 Tax=Chloropicon primus TaxID=1764295 RepID=A0A5B8MMD2_9CHLO|nr:hypothetical protein A3770_06p43160 [Chloropicon primus]|eukprot:QDZ21798.1 hypothetical protein A3770_06p43160 [Chloropicon primus]